MRQVVGCPSRTHSCAVVGRVRATTRVSCNVAGWWTRRSIVRASSNGSQPTVTNSVDEGSIGDFCTIDTQGKRVKERTIGEMEQEFLGALSSWYYDGKPTMTDAEFEVLKDELLWSGSKVPILDSDEQKFLEACQAYYKGTPVLTDEEYDELKATLRQKNSVVVAQGPRCSIRTKQMYSDAQPDYLRMTLLNVPAALLVLGLLFSVDDLTGFEITSLIELPPPLGLVALWGVLLPGIFVVATSLTNIVFRNSLVLKGTCPSCGTENYTYFGDIFNVSGNTGQNNVECTNCKATLTFDSNKRVVVVAETAEEKQAKIAAAAAKKAAAAAKKAAAAAKRKSAV